MAQNNQQSNQSNINQSYKKEDAYQSLGIINTWINNIDTKVSFALALASVLIGIIFSAGLPNAWQKVSEVSNLAELDSGEIIAAILVLLLYIVSFLSILFFMLAIIARVKNLNNAPSIFFFDSIGRMKLQDYEDKVSKITDQQIIEDLVEQIHTNSRIYRKKAQLYNLGAKFLVAAILLWFICMTFRLI